MRRIALLVLALALVAEVGAQGLFGHLHEPETLPLEEILGTEVLTPEGRSLGRITDLLIDRATGKVEEVAVENMRYPLRALVSADRPGQVVLAPSIGEASAGATALRPISSRAEEAYARASRELGSSDQISIDLREGRVSAQRRPQPGPASAGARPGD